MGDITIHVPQNIHVKYTLDNGNMTHRLLDMLNTIVLRNETISEEQDSLLGLFTDQSDLIDQITELAMQARETDPLRVQ